MKGPDLAVIVAHDRREHADELDNPEAWSSDGEWLRPECRRSARLKSLANAEKRFNRAFNKMRKVIDAGHGDVVARDLSLVVIEHLTQDIEVQRRVMARKESNGHDHSHHA